MERSLLTISSKIGSSSYLLTLFIPPLPMMRIFPDILMQYNRNVPTPFPRLCSIQSGMALMLFPLRTKEILTSTAIVNYLFDGSNDGIKVFL